MNEVSKRSLFALPFIIIGTLSLLYFGALAPEVVPSFFQFRLAGNQFIDGKLKYQIATFIIALVVLIITFALSPQHARTYYRLGNLDAYTEAVKWLDIKPTDTWKKVGINFAIIVSLATGAFVFFNVIKGEDINPEHIWMLPFILVLSAFNAFNEEAITRLSVVTTLHGILSRPVVYIVSALIFGIPHYFGIPGGLLGSLMAGFLGWLLAKSIAETKGMFWAWFIHFLQDVIIFTGLFLATL